MKQFFMALIAVIVLVLVFAVGYWLNLPGVHTFLGSANDALTEVFGAVFVGIKILFFVGLGLAIAWCVIELRRHSQVKVIRPGKHGPVQAVLHRGELVQLQNAGQQQLDPMQQMALLQKFIQVQPHLAKYAQPTTVQELDSSTPRRELEGPSALPTNINYQDIRSQVPRGHILVGIGRRGIETREYGVGACVWIVGLSGTGKTSTTVLRVEERAAAGHRFLGVDPHFYKPDSLTNAVKRYESRFLMPMAQTAAESKQVLKLFLDEFQGRKGGRIPVEQWYKLTLLVDEVGSLMDPTDDDEQEIKEMLPSIARICGQEARNFEMGGIFISQQATGLAWLRKVALMVIVHQLLQESEKKLATNNDTAVMLEMKTWPIGRTYVFGVGFQEGPRTVQQPRFDPAQESVIESTIEAVDGPTTESVQSISSSDGRHASELVEPMDRTLPFDMEKFRQAQKMLLARETQNKIICTVWNVQENTRQFRTAKEEFQLMLAYLASMASVEE